MFYSPTQTCISPQSESMTNATLRKLSDPMITAATIAQKTMTVDGMVTGKIAQPTTTAGTMPDLTTISDQDLLSYINPSCFDQGLCADSVVWDKEKRKKNLTPFFL